MRNMLRSGVWAMSTDPPPQPPVEWPDWKRDRKARCIDAAVEFYNGQHLNRIRGNRLHKVYGTGIKKIVTKQRAAQDIIKGTEFLVEYHWLYRVSPLDQKRAG